MAHTPNEPEEAQAPAAPTDEEPRRSLLGDILEWVVVIALALGILWVGREFVIEPFEVPTGSMLQTIQLGDRLYAEKVSYRFRTPSRGEVVLFRDPKDNETVLVKRVVALAGQTVDLRDGAVYVDDEKLDEPYTNGKESYPLGRHASNLASDIEFPYTVPEGHIWAMGDNRTDSLDSRYFGPVPYENLVGRAFLVYLPLSNFKFL